MISQKLIPVSIQETFLRVAEQSGHKNSQSDEIFGHRIDYNIGSINA